MDFRKYKKSFTALQNENNFYRLILIGMAILIAVMTVALINKKTIVTIQPFTLTRDAQVTEDAGSQTYMEAWGLALAEVIGNVHPGNVDFIGEHLKPLLAPEIYHRALDAIQADAQQMREDRVSLRFEPLRVVYERSTDKIFVYGNSFIRAGSGYEKETREPRTYEFRIRVANYLPEIFYIDTYEGVPRTRDELTRIEKKEAGEAARERKRERESNFVRKTDEKAEEAARREEQIL